MTTDNKTLADVQPGGRVRPGDAPWPEIDAILADAYSAGAEGLPFEGIARRAAVRKAVAALSAQPSPGGQGDSRSEKAETFLRQYLTYLRSSPRQGLRPRWCDVYEALEVAIEALAARQPVGELHLPADGFYKIVYDDAEVPDESFARTGALDAARRRFEQISARWNAHLFVRFAHNTSDCTVPNATPAQAVDLGQIWQQAFNDTAHSYRRNKSRLWVLQILKERVQALIDSQAVGNG